VSLHELGLKHGTDKSTFHKYMDFYEKHIPKNDIKTFLEIGVQGGFSLRTWREWFDEDCEIEGWDINPLIHISGCTVKIVDQAERKQIKSSSRDFYDLIIDDGGHTPEQMQTSFSVLFPKCKYYIIEDLHAPWCGSEFMPEGEENTVDLIERIPMWSSKHSTKEESDYINQNAEVVELYIQGERHHPQSMTVFIKNRQNLE